MNQTRRLPTIATLLLVIAMTIILACGSESPTTERTTTAPPASENTDLKNTPDSPNDAETASIPATENTEAMTPATTASQPAKGTPSPTVDDATKPPQQTPGQTATTDPATGVVRPQSTPGPQVAATEAPHQGPTPETGGICSRTPAVKEAIMEALAATSCSAVTEDQLAQVDSLTLSTDKVDADDVAGLTGITTIDLTLTGAPMAQLASLTTLKNATISLTLPPTIPSGTRLTAEQIAQNEKNKADYTVADDFLPFGETHSQYGDRVPNPDPDGQHFDSLRFNITGGGLVNEHMARQLLQRRYQADNLTVDDDSSEAYGILRSRSEYKEANLPLTFRSVKNLTLILNHPPGKDGSVHTGKHWLYRDWVDSITIINENSNRALQIRSDFMTCEAGAKATYSADSVSYHTFKLEIRGRIEIDPAAFKYCHAIELLSLDPDPYGKLHQLKFDRGVTPPQGTGFTVLPN